MTAPALRITSTRHPRWGNPVTYGWLGSALIIVTFLALLTSRACGLWGWSCESRWATLMEGEPGAIGAMLAGVAGALGALWIVVAVLLQTRELRAQREELRLMRELLTRLGERAP